MREEELSGFLDDELDPEARAQWEATLADDPVWADELAALREVQALVADDDVPMPSLDQWDAFTVELERRLPAQRRWGVWGARAAAVLLAAVGVWAAGQPLTVSVAAASRLSLPSLRYSPVEVSAAPAQPLPSLDAVARAEGARRDLSRAAAARLAEEGAVQVPSLSSELGGWYAENARVDRPVPLATADASLWVAGSVRAAGLRVLERELIVPHVRLVLTRLAPALAELEAEVPGPALREGARRARRLVGVARLLEGDPSGLPGSDAAQARELVAQLEAGRVVESPWFEGSIDGRALRPRGGYEDDPVLARHHRAAAWLARCGLSVDPARGTSLRAAGLLALAAAQAELLPALDRLEAAITLVAGPPDELTVFDLLHAVREGVGTTRVSVSALRGEAVWEAIAEHARSRARGRTRRVRSGGEVGAVPRFHLLGSTRGVEAQVLERLLTPGVPGRVRASVWDAFAALGSRRARTILSAYGDDAPGYDLVSDAVAVTLEAALDPAGSAGWTVEHGQLWVAQALLQAPLGPDPYLRAPGYRDRLLAAAQLALCTPAAAEWESLGPWAEGPVPLVEPLPGLHGRLAATSRRFGRALLVVGEGEAFARVARALEAVAHMEEALEAASRAQLEGRPVEAGVRRVLAGWAGYVRALGGGRVAAVEDVAVARRGAWTEVLHRVVGGVDRLVVVAWDPARGGPVLASGPVVRVDGRWSGGERWRAGEVGRLSAPRWASLIEED